jgi:hypothetical protein
MLLRARTLMKSAFSTIRLRMDRTTPRELALIGELRANCRQLPERQVNGASDAENTWSKVANHFRYLVATEDPRNFLTWDHLGTMFFESPQYVDPELAHLMRSQAWAARWSRAIEESEVGQPSSFPSYPQTSGNLIHHAYHLCRFEEMTGEAVDSFDLVIEFGGGYGSMCRLFHQLGFQGKYVIFDFAEFSYLQQFFLQSLDLPVHSPTALERQPRGIATISDVEQLIELTRSLRTLSPRALFVATWSLSETSVAFRREVLKIVELFDCVLIAYQEKFGEVDNHRFFADWKNTKRKVQWHHWPIEHLPGHFYLMGKKRPDEYQ